MSQPLSNISATGSYRVTNIQGADSTRIMEMGITPGVTIELIRKAPTGYPLEVKVRGYMLSLRKKEADCIHIELNT